MRFAVNTFSSIQLKSYKLPHIILTAFLFFNAAHSYATNYTWAGPSSGGDWHTAANWSPTGIPTINDDVTVSGVVSISAGDAEAKMLTIQNGLVELENVNLKLEKLICQGISSFKGAGNTGNGTGTLKFTGSASFSTGSTLCTFANIEVDTGTALTLHNDITVKRNFVNNGAVTTATGSLTINGNYSGAGSLSASSITINFKGDVDFSQGTFSGSSRTVKLNGIESQKIKINASGTDFGNLEINKTSRDVTIEESEGTLSAASLKITSAPGGVTVNAPLSVTGILEHTGGGNALFTKRVTAQTLRHSGIGTADFSEEVVTPNLEHTGTNTLTFQKKIQIAASFTDNTSSGALNFNGGADFMFTSQTEFKTYQLLTLAGNCSFGGGMKRSGAGATNISGKITTVDKAIDFSSSNSVTLTSDTTMETGSGNITFDEKVLGAPKKLEIKTSGTAKFNKGFDNNFALHLTGKAEIKEDNTFSSFKVDNSSIAAATSVKFQGGKTQTINNSISLKGNAVSKPLTLGSTNSTKWNVYFSSVPTYEDFSYVVVDKSKSVDSGGNAHKLNLSQSDDYVKDSNYSPATTENWFSADFYWKGTADSNWANVANWAYPDGNPRNHVPAHIGSTADVTIDTAAGGNDLELGNGIGSPLTTSLALKSLTVKADKRIGLGKCKISAADKIENKGTIALYGNQTATLPPVLSSPDTAHLPTSAIEYYGAENGSDVLAITMPTPPVYTYKKLIVKKSAGKTMTFNNGISADSFDASVNAGKIIFNNGTVTTTGEQKYAGALELGADVTFTASKITFSATVDGSKALTIAGSAPTEFNGVVGNTAPLTTLTTGTGLTTINAASIKTSGSQTYKGKLELGANAKIQTVNAASVTFEETVNSASAGTNEFSLTIEGAAKPEFKKDVGLGTKGLAALTTDTNTEAVINTSNIKTSGTQTYKGKVTLSKNTTLTAPASNIKFDGTVDGAQSLTIAGNAAVEFNNPVGSATSLAALTTGTGLTTINAASINTSGIQTYKGSVSLNKNTSLEASSVTFEGTLDGAYSLTLAGATAQTFSGITGGTTALSSLTTGTGTTTINTSSIKTNGIQTYKGKVILNTDSTLDSGSLMFEDAINSAANDFSGAKDLTLLCAGVQTFKTDIGNVHPLKSFTSGTGDIVLQCSSIKTRAAQTYKGKLKLEHDVSLVSTAEAGGVILFESSVEDNAAHSLSVETGNDYIAFRLPSFMTGAKIQTGGSQTFKAAKGLRLLSESDFTWSAGGSGINLEPNTTDLYTDCAAAVKVTLASDLSCRNFYFYKGKFSAGSSKITSAKDFAVWGSNYNADDPRFSGTDTRFEFYTQLPLDYPVPTSKGAAFENLAGAQFIVGGNFYINGTDLNASSLALTLPDNTSSKPVFNPNAAVTERQWGIPYAAAFNMSAANVTASRWITAGGAQIQNVIDGGGNTNWQFDMPKIVDAYTVYDDVVYVKFNMDLENSNGEIATNLALAAAPGATLPSGGVWYNGGTLAMLGAYSDPDCSSPIVNGDITAAQGLYIKTNGGKWNTDATGTEAYGTDSTTTLDSTDRSGVHRNVKTDLSFLEGIFTAANGHTMCGNYGIGLEGGTSTPSYTNVSDKCAPVLIKVYTGQEQHTAPDGTASMTNYDADSQKPYDAHNFIEFRYSEPVDTGALKLIDKTIDAKQINIKATGTFGAINNSSSSPKLSIEGIAKIANGSLQTGSLGNADNLVHSLYRKFSRTPGAVPAFESHRLRVAISGYADTVVSDGVKSYYNWQGYIDSAESPSGRITRVSDNKIKDKAGNTPDSAGAANHTLAQLSVESADDGLYGKWDVLPPVFASFMHRVRSDITGYEALGTANPGSTTLERLEFHLFDNAENDSDWYIKLGWSNDSGNNLVVSDAYGADIFGGSKPFAIPASGRTSGGIRYSTVYGKSSSFKYGIGAGSAATTSFAPGNIKAGAQSLVFSPYTTPRHSSTQTDGLYISIDLPALSQLPFNTIFSVKYDDSGFVTDLAGNRMKTSTITTIDRSPPGFNMTVAAVKDPASSAEVFKELYVVFSKKLELNLIPIYDSLGTATAVNALEKIPACLRFINSSTFSPISDISVVGVTEKFSNSNYTGLILKLNRTLTLEDIKSTYLQCYVESADKSTDPLSGIPNTYVSYIQDHLGNYLPNFSAHPISDFAVNVVQPVYAYDDRYAGTGGSDMTDIFDSSVAAYDWNEEQRKLGTLIMEHDIFIYAKFNDGAQQTPASVNVNAYFDLVSQLTPGAVSVNYNKNTSDVSNWRVWLPNKINKGDITPLTAFSALSPEFNDINKTSVITLSGEYRGDNKPLIFNLPYKGGTSISTAGWSSGDQISFLFGLADTGNIPIKIRHNPVWDEHTSTYTGEESPLFALRLKNPSDITSVDLWSFKMQKQKSQRGGVTVLNNVINALKAEKMTLQVDMPSAGTLNVIIMTLDGDIVKYLHHGQAESGSHYFTWDGTTKNGGLTARGLYFIRVFGNGIDETRKVMVIKD